MTLIARAGFIAAALAAFQLGAGCGNTTRPCKQGTLLATVNFDSTTSMADHVEVRVTVEGSATTQAQSLSHRPGTFSGTVEIDFPAAGGGYPGGKRVDVSVTATKSGMPLGAGTKSTPSLATGCDTLAISLVGGIDGGGGAGGTGGGGGSAGGTGGYAGGTGGRGGMTETGGIDAGDGDGGVVVSACVLDMSNIDQCLVQ